MHVVPRVALAAVYALCATPVAAQERLTLPDAVHLAITRNPAATAADAGVAAADARSTEARAGYFPRIDFSEAWQRSNQPVFAFGSLLNQGRFTAADFALDTLNHPDPLTNFRAAVTIEQPVYDAGRTAAAAHSAEAAAGTARADRDRVIADLRLEAVRAYTRAVITAAQRTSAESAYAAAKEDLARVTNRRDRGVETDAAVLEMQVLADTSEAEQVRAREDENVARAALNGVIGAPLDARFELDPLVLEEPALPDEAAVEQSAVTANPALRHAELAASAAEVALGGAHHSLLPSVVALGSVEGNGATFGDRASSWAAGMQFRWSLSAGGAESARVKSASEALRAATSERAVAETSVRLEARTALAVARSAAAQERATRSSLDHARESQRITRDRYDAGLATSADLLRAAEMVTRAESQRVTAVGNVQVAIAALAHAMGKESVK